MSQESDVCCTTSVYDIQNRCIPDEIDLVYFKTCIITHNNNVIEQNINVSMFDILSVKELHTMDSLCMPLFIYLHTKLRRIQISVAIYRTSFLSTPSPLLLLLFYSIRC